MTLDCAMIGNIKAVFCLPLFFLGSEPSRRWRRRLDGRKSLHPPPACQPTWVMHGNHFVSNSCRKSNFPWKRRMTLSPSAESQHWSSQICASELVGSCWSRGGGLYHPPQVNMWELVWKTDKRQSPHMECFHLFGTQKVMFCLQFSLKQKAGVQFVGFHLHDRCVSPVKARINFRNTFFSNSSF